jgi:hypothetical protein
MTTAPKLPEGLEPVAWRVIEAWESSPLRSHDGMLFERIEDLRAALSDAQAALQALAAEKDAEIAALKLDAARYRWIKADEGDLFRVIQLSVAGHLYDQVIDHAIDSAIALAAKEAK